MLLYRAITNKEKILLENGYLECRRPKLSDRNPSLNYTDYGNDLNDEQAYRKHFFLTLDDALSYENDMNTDPWGDCYESLSLTAKNIIKGIAVFDMPLDFIEDYLNIGIYGLNINQNRRAVVESAIIVQKLDLKYGEEDKKIISKINNINFNDLSYIKLKSGVLKDIIEDYNRNFEIKDARLYLDILKGKIKTYNLNRLQHQLSLFEHSKKSTKVKKITYKLYQ